MTTLPPYAQKPANATTISTLLFDMDGTIVDNFEALHKAFSYAHEQLGLPIPTFDKVRRTIGGSAPISMAKLVGEDYVSRAMPFFNEYFAKNMFNGLNNLPGTLWLLTALKARGIKMAIFTNKTGAIARPMCDYLNISQFFDAIIGAGDTPWRKPQPEFTRYALEQMQSTPETTALIGDSPYDLKAAQAGNIAAWLVSTGTHSTEELLASTPPLTTVFSDLYQLGETIYNFRRE